MCVLDNQWLQCCVVIAWKFSMKWNGYIYFPACFSCSVWQHIECWKSNWSGLIVQNKILFHSVQWMEACTSVLWCAAVWLVGNHILFESNIIPHKPKFDRSWQSFNVNGSWYEDDNVPALPTAGPCRTYLNMMNQIIFWKFILLLKAFYIRYWLRLDGWWRNGDC